MPQSVTIKALAELLSRAEGFDLSWSFSASGRVQERALFFLDATPQDAQALAAAASALGMDRATIADWSASLPGADALGLTVARNPGSVRLYAQFWDRLTDRVGMGDLSPFPLYRGFKQTPGGPARRDDYLCHPLAPRSRFWPPMAQAMHSFGMDEAATDMAFAGLTGQHCIWTQTDAGARRSWLATVRRAPIDTAALRRALLPLTARPGIAALSDALQRAPLLHLAGGQDAEKGSFLTFYVQATAPDVSAFLHRCGLMPVAPPDQV